MKELSESLKAQWDTSKNPFGPFGVSANSHKKAWWIGECGHSWNANIQSRTRGAGCPYCAGKATLSGFNDLATTHPEIASEWHFDKNDILPTEVRRGYKQKVWWLGNSCGHEWFATVNNRVAGRQGCAVCYNRQLVPGVNDLQTTHPEIASEWADARWGPTEVVAGSNVPVTWRCATGHEWTVSPDMRSSLKTNCPKCSTVISSGHREVSEYIESLGFVIENNVRGALGGKIEIDIFVPEKMLAIEFNGLFWHTEDKKGKLYHKEKTDAAKENGIRLIHIWEDEWNIRRTQVQSMIKSVLGVLDSERLSARNTMPSKISASVARKFLEDNHIQGAPRVSSYFGLYMDEEVVAVLAVRSLGGGKFSIDRFATNKIVRGGFSKLLGYAEKDLPVSEWVTFSDLSHSNGELYLKTGFVVDRVIPPDYKYLYKNRRVHKFLFRKSRFALDSGMVYADGATEKQLSELNNLSRVWDCGKIRFVKTVQNCDTLK